MPGSKWLEKELRILKELYPDQPQKIILKNIKRSWKSIRAKAFELNIIRDKKVIQVQTIKATKESNLKKYGVESSFQRKDVKEKTIQTNRERHGVDYPSQSKEIREKSRKKYQETLGVDNPFMQNWVKEKAKKANQTEEVIERRKKTCEEKYGVDNPFKNKEIQKQIKQTLINKYGVDNPLKNDSIKEKVKQTCKEKYGVESPIQNKEIKEKIEKTNLEKYGYKTPLQNEEVKEKCKQTLLKNWGVENPAQSEEIMNKIIKTNKERYNVDFVFRLKEFRNPQKSKETKLKNSSNHISKQEKLFTEYLKGHIDPDIETQKTHPELNFTIDFYSKKLNLWVQFDGFHWHGKNLNIEDLENHSEATKRGSQVHGILKTMRNDVKQNKNIKNLVRIWSDDFLESVKNNTISEFLKNKFKGLQK